jgi:GDP-mannose 6-dehydrogenase
MKISVFGIGYVGAVTSACLAKSGHQVIAVDTSDVKVECLNEGRSPIIENELDELIEKSRNEGKLEAVHDHEYAVMNSDISLICVGTPSHDDGSLNLNYIEEICHQIGAALKDKDDYHTVVNRSTVVPGTLLEVIKPILEHTSGKEAGKDFGLGNNPEFLREGSAVKDYFEPTQIVIGALDQRTAENILAMYTTLDAPRTVTDVSTAEGVKYVSNAWRATKVGFANEIGNMLKRHGVDSHEVMKIFFEDKKINMGPSFLMPGYAFGGSCLPKDIRAICASSNDMGLPTPVFNAILEANNLQVRHAFDLIEETGRRNVGLLGLSFKPGTDALRESPLAALAELLITADYKVLIYDPSVWLAKQINGANGHYLEEKVPHLSGCLVETPEQLLDNSDVLVLGNGTKEFAEILERAEEDIPIVDLVRLHGPYESRESYEGICW